MPGGQYRHAVLAAATVKRLVALTYLEGIRGSGGIKLRRDLRPMLYPH